MALRQRSVNKTDKQQTKSSDIQKLKESLDELWKKVEKEGTVTRKEYNRYIYSLVKGPGVIKPGQHKKRKCCRLFSMAFDCVWTVVLLLVVSALIVVYTPSVKNFVSSKGHAVAYDVNRVLRFLFIAVNPYFLKTGLDFSSNCVVPNPFVNDSMKCPCIRQSEPIIVQLNQSPVPEEVMNNPDNVYVLRNAVPIDKEYGRKTLVDLFDRTGSLPRLCFQTGVQDITDAIDYYHLVTNDAYWNGLLLDKDPWFFTWLECPLNDASQSIHSLLPDHMKLVKGMEERSPPYYTLATQWAHSFSPTLQYDQDDHKNRATNNRHMLLVLQGTLQIRIDSSEVCVEYCQPSRKLLTLTEGDALLYKEQYWFIYSRTWSNMSFAVTSHLNFDN